MKIVATTNREFPFELRISAKETGEEKMAIRHKSWEDAKIQLKEIRAFLLIRKPLPRGPIKNTL